MLSFEHLQKPDSIESSHWKDWKWHIRNSLKSEKDFDSFLKLTEDEKFGFKKGKSFFSFKTTPYYAYLCKKYKALRQMTLPCSKEFSGFYQEDPLGEKRHTPTPRIIHRYPDRVLFLVTDFCGIYCRYCTRKYFTAQGHHTIPQTEYSQALEYIQNNQGIREVILSGGDPLTLSDEKLGKILDDIRSISHVEIIRIGTKMLTVCPFRITSSLIEVLTRNQPVFIMSHFNHPKELTQDAKNYILKLCDHGISVFNQMVLLNGINNHPALVQSLNRRLLYLRVKPYYMFQCDPSRGTDHFRTQIENSKWIQKELWGKLSGLATPRLSVDLPHGGGKVELVPDHWIEKTSQGSTHRGFDGLQATYPEPKENLLPNQKDLNEYLPEWNLICHQPYGQ